MAHTAKHPHKTTEPPHRSQREGGVMLLKSLILSCEHDDTYFLFLLFEKQLLSKDYRKVEFL